MTPEGNVLTSTNNSDDFAKRDLMRTVTEPHLFTYDLLHYFSNNRSELANSAFQTLFDILFFKPVDTGKDEHGFSINEPVAFDQLVKEPELLAQSLELINNGLNDFWYRQPSTRPNIHACLFFIRFADRIRSALPEERRKEVLPDENQILTGWLGNKDLSHSDKSAIHLHRLYHYIQKSKARELSSSELQTAYQSYLFFANNPIDQEWADPYLTAEAEKFARTMSKPMQAWLDSDTTQSQERDAFFNELFVSLAIEIPEHHWHKGSQANLYTPATDSQRGRCWSVDIETGQLRNGPELFHTAEPPKWEQHRDYQRLFGNRRFQYRKANKTIYFHAPGLGNFRTVNYFLGTTPYEAITRLQRQFDGKWYQHIHVDSLPKEFPHSLKTDHAFWLSPDPTTPSYITDLKTGEICYIVDKDKEIIPYSDKDLPDEKKRTLSPFLHATDYDHKALASFERPEYIEMWKKGAERATSLDSINFPRYLSLGGNELRFDIQTGSDGSREALWHDDKQYRLADTKAPGLLGTMNNYLLLESRDKKKRKLLIPLQKALETPHLSTEERLDVVDEERKQKEYKEFGGGSEELNVSQRGHNHFIEIDLVNGKPEPKDNEGKLFLTYLYLGQREYSQALQSLRSVTQSDSMSKESLDILSWIVSLGGSNKDFSANAASVRLQAYKKLIDYERRPGTTFSPTDTPPSNKLKKEALADYKNYIDSANNVAAALRFSREEELDLLDYSLGSDTFPRRYQYLKTDSYGNDLIQTLAAPSTAISPTSNARSLPVLPNRYRDSDDTRAHPKAFQPSTYEDERKDETLFYNFSDSSGDRRYKEEQRENRVLTKPYIPFKNDFIPYYNIAKGNKAAEREALLFFLEQIDISNLSSQSEIASQPCSNWVLYHYLLFAVQYPDDAPDLPADYSPETLFDFHIALNKAYNKKQKQQEDIAAAEQPQRIAAIAEAKREVTAPLFTPGAELAEAPQIASAEEPLIFTRIRATTQRETPLQLLQSWMNADHRTEDPSLTLSLEEGDITTTEESYREAIQREFSSFSDDLAVGRKENVDTPHYTLSRSKNFSDLEKVLSKGIASQQEHLRPLEKILLSLANRKPTEANLALRESMVIGGRAKKELELNDLILLFLKGRKELFTLANSNLTAAEIERLYNLTGEYLLASVELQQWQRAENDAKLLVAMDQDNVPSDDPTRIYYTERLGNELHGARRYGKDVEGKENPTFDPVAEVPLLVFEYFSNMQLRPKQIRLIQQMTRLEATGNRYEDIVIQLIMGGGKTAVLASILGHRAAKPGRLSLFVTPASQFHSVRENLKNAQRKHFRQEIDTIDLVRKEFTAKNLQWIRNKLKKTIEHEEMLVIKSEMLQSLELEFLSCAHQYLHYAGQEPPAQLIEKIKLLREILLIFRDQSDALIDEIDLVLNALREVNFPIGEGEHVKRERTDLVKHVMALLTSDTIDIGEGKTMADLVGIRRNEQALLSSQDYQNRVKPALAKEIAQYPHLLVPAQHSDSLIRYLEGKIHPDLQLLADYEERAVPPEKGAELDRIRMWISQQPNSDELTQDVAFLVLLAKKAESNNPKIVETAELIALAKHMLDSLLPATLSKSCGRHFGRTKSGDHAGEVVPYQGVDTPATTKFGYHYEAMIYHYITALSQGITSLQLLNLAKKFKVAAQYSDKPFQDTEEAKEFLSLTEVPLEEIDAPGKLEEATANLNKNIAHLLTAETETVTHYVTYYTKRFSSSPQDLVDQLNTRRGMSGTPWNAPGYHSSLDENTLLDRGTEGQITDIMLRRAKEVGDKNVHIIETRDVEELLTSTLAGHMERGRFHGIIDVGGHFKGSNNKEVACGILRHFAQDPTSEIEGVLFYLPPAGPDATEQERKHAGQLAVWKKGAKTYDVIGGTSKEHLSTIGIPLSKLFVYYDENHTTGSDILQTPTSKNFITVDERLLRRNFFQGILRLRQYFFFQDVEYLVPKGAQDSLINRGTTVKDLIKSGIKFQTIRLAMDTYRSFKQQLDNTIRQQALKHLFDKETPEEIRDAFRLYENLLVTSSGDSLFAQFGRLARETPTIEALEHYKKMALQRFPQGSQYDQERRKLEGSLNTVIERAKRCPVLQKEVFESHANLFGMEQELNIELQQEAETTQERELENELQNELQRYNMPFSGAVLNEIEWRSIPTIEELTTPNPNPTKSRKDNDRHPDILSLKQAFTSIDTSLFQYERPYEAIFDDNILITDNCRFTGSNASPVFSKYQKPGEHILAIQKEDGHMSFILLSNKDAERFKQHLKTSDNPEAKRMWLIFPDGSLIQGNKHNPALPDSSDCAQEISRALLQVNLFNGNVHYLNKHKDEAERWLNEEPKEDKIRFMKLKVENNPVQRQLFDKSPLLQ
ncbi:DUF3638 domain-containing protein [Simkania negevensis]|uniref:DUF3638 domain-containing protein n=1 Tax=Simkania negevensis TaxID=83561 RepID=A0ABS3ARM9_9BACT|nr:DUF3638 domain-containing protein [Simkania negevensis]